MKKRISSTGWFIIVLLATALLLFVCFFAVQNATVNTVVSVETQADNTYDKTITVVGDSDYDPFSFLDKNGNPSGYNVELINELANRMGYNVELSLMPWQQAVQSVKNGEADIVLSVSRQQELSDGIKLSIPLESDPYVAFGNKKYTRIEELYDKRLAVLENTGCIGGFIEPYHLSENTTEYSSVSEVFKAVNEGEADYAIVRFSAGRRAIMDSGYKGLFSVGPTLLNEYMYIGMSNDNAQLESELNDAVIAASADGTLSKLSDKWLGAYVDALTLGKFVATHTELMLTLAVMLLLIFFIGILLINSSISRSRERLLLQLAQRDRLTGLYNRTACEALVRRTLEDSISSQNIHALLVMDIDNFKRINDTYGHFEGDAALVSLADTLRRTFRQSDLIGRLGGDEFFVFMPGCASADTPTKKADQIGAAFGKEREICNEKTRLTLSIGVALYPKHGSNFNELYKSADVALYEAKRCGKHGYAIADDNGEIKYFQTNL